MNYFPSPIWFALILTRSMTMDKLYSYRGAYLHTGNLGVSGFSCRIFSIFESSQFLTDLKDSGL